MILNLFLVWLKNTEIWLNFQWAPQLLLDIPANWLFYLKLVFVEGQTVEKPLMAQLV